MLCEKLLYSPVEGAVRGDSTRLARRHTFGAHSSPKLAKEQVYLRYNESTSHRDEVSEKGSTSTFLEAGSEPDTTDSDKEDVNVIESSRTDGLAFGVSGGPDGKNLSVGANKSTLPIHKHTSLITSPVVSSELSLDSSALCHKLTTALRMYPPGTVNRWQHIVDCIGDPSLTEEGIRSNISKFLYHSKIESEGNSTPRTEITIKNAKEWNSVQQRQLENALRELQSYEGSDKWSEIALRVEGKSRNECMQRYRYLSSKMNCRKT